MYLLVHWGVFYFCFKRSSSFYFFYASVVGVVIAIVHSHTIDVSFGVGDIMGIVVMPVAV